MPELFESNAIEHDPHTEPGLAPSTDLTGATAEKHEPSAPTPEPDDVTRDSGEPPATPEAWSAPAALLTSPAAVPELVPPPAGAGLGQGTHIKVWKFLLLLVGVWIPAAAAGVGLYYWWYVSLNKTWPLFVLLVLVVASVVGGLLLAMVPDRPVISTIAIAVMSVPFAALVAAAVLHGAYYFQWIERPG